MKCIFFLLMMIGLISCDKETSEPNGYQGDTIKLSTKELSFSSQPSTKEVTTEGEQWVISLIANEDTDLDYSKDNIVMTIGDVGKNENTPLKIEGDWFTITRELKKITVELKDNDTNKKRVVKIGVADRNYFDRITVEQDGN